MSLLRIWLAGTAIALAVMAAWAFAPVLVFIALLVAGLGIIAAGMIWLAHRLRIVRRARQLRGWRERR